MRSVGDKEDMNCVYWPNLRNQWLMTDLRDDLRIPFLSRDEGGILTQDEARKFREEAKQPGWFTRTRRSAEDAVMSRPEARIVQDLTIMTVFAPSLLSQFDTANVSKEAALLIARQFGLSVIGQGVKAFRSGVASLEYKKLMVGIQRMVQLVASNIGPGVTPIPIQRNMRQLLSIVGKAYSKPELAIALPITTIPSLVQMSVAAVGVARNTGTQASEVAAAAGSMFSAPTFSGARRAVSSAFSSAGNMVLHAGVWSAIERQYGTVLRQFDVPFRHEAMTILSCITTAIANVVRRTAAYQKSKYYEQTRNRTRMEEARILYRMSTNDTVDGLTAVVDGVPIGLPDLPFRFVTNDAGLQVPVPQTPVYDDHQSPLPGTAFPARPHGIPPTDPNHRWGSGQQLGQDLEAAAPAPRPNQDGGFIAAVQSRLQKNGIIDGRTMAEASASEASLSEEERRLKQRRDLFARAAEQRRQDGKPLAEDMETSYTGTTETGNKWTRGLSPKKEARIQDRIDAQLKMLRAGEKPPVNVSMVQYYAAIREKEQQEKGLLRKIKELEKMLTESNALQLDALKEQQKEFAAEKAALVDEFQTEYYALRQVMRAAHEDVIRAQGQGGSALRGDPGRSLEGGGDPVAMTEGPVLDAFVQFIAYMAMKFLYYMFEPGWGLSSSNIRRVLHDWRQLFSHLAVDFDMDEATETVMGLDTLIEDVDLFVDGDVDEALFSGVLGALFTTNVETYFSHLENDTPADVSTPAYMSTPSRTPKTIISPRPDEDNSENNASWNSKSIVTGDFSKSWSKSGSVSGSISGSISGATGASGRRPGSKARSGPERSNRRPNRPSPYDNRRVLGERRVVTPVGGR